MSNPTMEPSYPQLLSLAVHELRTPASVVGGYLRMLQRDSEQPLSERHRKMVDEAEKSCTRLVALIAELSDVGKLDAGTFALARQPLDLFALIGELAEHVHEARDREVQFHVRGDAAGAWLEGDAPRLRTTFDAIFRTILREKAGPSVVVADRRLEVVGGRRCGVVIVADEPSVQAAYESPAGLFDEKRGGMGLALPIARRIIERHGGRIWSPATEPLSRAAIVVTIPVT